MLKIILSVIILIYSASSFGLYFDEKIQITSKRNDVYEYKISLGPSDHGTRNDFEVSLRCLKTNKKSEKLLGICNFDRNSIKVKKVKDELVFKVKVYRSVNWSKYYDEMEKVKDAKSECDLDTYEEFELIIEC